MFPSDSLAITTQNPTSGCPDCKVCSGRAAGKGKQTQWQCKTCKVAMCVYPCFERYHTVKHYKQQILCTHQVHTDLPLCIYFHNYSKAKTGIMLYLLPLSCL